MYDDRDGSDGDRDGVGRGVCEGTGDSDVGDVVIWVKLCHLLREYMGLGWAERGMVPRPAPGPTFCRLGGFRQSSMVPGNPGGAQ